MSNKAPTPFINDYREWLLNIYLIKRAKNPSFSLASFAKNLGISKSILSEIVNKKRHLSLKNVEKIAKKLNLSQEGIQRVISEIENKATIKNKLPEKKFYDYLKFKEDQVEAMSDWYCIGIMCISQLKNHEANTELLSKRLNISESEVKSAMEILERLKLIKISKNKIKRTTALLYVSSNIPSAAIRKYHKQNLKLAEKAIEDTPITERYLTSFSIPTNIDKIKDVQKLVDSFREKLAKFLETETPEDVYTCALQLFPITNKNVK